MRNIYLLALGLLFFTSCGDDDTNEITEDEVPPIDIVFNRAPVAVADTFKVNYADSIYVDLIQNDYDPDGDSILVTDAQVGSGPNEGYINHLITNEGLLIVIDSNGADVFSQWLYSVDYIVSDGAQTAKVTSLVYIEL